MNCSINNNNIISIQCLYAHNRLIIWSTKYPSTAVTPGSLKQDIKGDLISELVRNQIVRNDVNTGMSIAMKIQNNVN